MKKFLFYFSCLLILSSVLNAGESPVMIRGIRPLGMGGAFVAVSDDQNAVFYNPAGITQRTGAQLTVFELPISVSEDVFNIYSFYNDNEDKLKNFDSLSSAEQNNLINEINDKMLKYRAHLKLGFPNISYLSGPKFINWGIGLFDQADVSFKFNRELLVPSVSFTGNVDILGAIPLAHRFDSVPYLPGKLSAGLLMKYINRGKIDEERVSVLEFEDFDPDVQTGNGLGFDVGTLYQLNDRWNVGLAVSDIGGTSLKFKEVKSDEEGTTDKPAIDSVISPRCNVGAAYIPSKIYYWPGRSLNTLKRFTFAADVTDVFNSDEPLLEATFWKKTHFGGEFRWSPFAVRGGFNSGYPSFGVGVNLYILTFDYAFWGDELGRYAGQIVEWNHQISIAMRFGQNKGRAYGKAAKETPKETQVETPKETPQETPKQVPNEVVPSAYTVPVSTTSAISVPVSSGPVQNIEPAQTLTPATTETMPIQ